MDLGGLNIWPDWEVIRLIGEGSFGKVYEIVRNNFGIEERCAAKVISIPSSQAEFQSIKNEGMDDASATEYYRGLVEEFVQEIALMSKLKGNVNVVGYEDYAVIEHKDSIGWDIIIRMELLTALPDYIKNNSFDALDVIKLATDMCNALEICHSHKIIHRDIKLDNIFISENGDYKLGDFGVARTIEKTISGLSKKGTYTYMAPEVYKGQPYGTNVDIYSLGIVMYKLLNNNREPFLPPHPELIKYSDKNNALVRRLNGEIIPPPANADRQISNIILKACNFRSGERYQNPTQMKSDLQAVINTVVSNATPVLQADYINAASPYKIGQILNTSKTFNETFLIDGASTNNQNTNSNLEVFIFDENSNNPNQSYQYTNNQASNYWQSTYQQPTYISQIYQQQGTDYQNNIHNKWKTPLLIANILGCIGAVLWTISGFYSEFEILKFFVMYEYFSIPPFLMNSFLLLIVLAMDTMFVILCFKLFQKYRKTLSIIMLVLSIMCFNVFSIPSAIIYICICNKSKF